MDDFSDRTLARRLLEYREHGYSLPLFFQGARRSYAIVVLVYGIPVVACAVLQSWLVCCFMLGVLCGVPLRDLGWARAFGRAWPFNQKVIDWNKVQDLANEQVPSP